MLTVSVRRAPVDPDSLRRSDPARSTRLRLPVGATSVSIIGTLAVFQFYGEHRRELISINLMVIWSELYLNYHIVNF